MAKPSPLRVVSDASSEDIRGLPVLTAYGDSDDHLRLAVLIADTLKKRGTGRDLAALAQTCMARETSWNDRRGALWDMIKQATPKRDGTYFGVLVDPDALDLGPLGPDATWNDRTFSRQRTKFREQVEQMVKRNGWLVVRGQPSPNVALPPPESTPLMASGNALARVSPEVRPLLSWLVQSGNMGWRDLERRFDAGRSDPDVFERQIVFLTYNALPERAIAVAEHLCLLRPTLPVEKCIGPYPILNDEEVIVAKIMEEEAWVDRASLDVLRAAGILQRGRLPDGREGLRMPRSVRAFLLQQVDMVLPPWLGPEHRQLAATAMEQEGLDGQLEIHHHAVQVHPAQQADIERAFDTARYYVADLREMAYRLSTVEKRYDAAAAIYKRIVETNKTDAYAWEYLGYNLALAYKDRPLPDKVREQIVEAYENAIHHDPNGGNPLYDGRLLGFRARLDEDVGLEFQQKMHIYKKWSPTAVSFFAESVLQGVTSSAKRSALVQPWREMFLSNDRLAHFAKDAA